jgi:hypothetical protein
MKKRSVALALGMLLLSGGAFDGRPALALSTGAGSADTATSPAGAELPPGASAPRRLMHHARQYRGNPAWLGVIVGGLLLVGLGSGVAVLLRHSSRAS